MPKETPASKEATVGSKEYFVSLILEQSIFKTHGERKMDQADDYSGYNTIVCRNNSDVFFTSKNLVRCCSINQKTTNYKLMKAPSSFDYFLITQLVMNTSETLMALVGKYLIHINTLPKLNMDDPFNSYIHNSVYEIHNINGKVKKVIWQAVAQNDQVLVVLNDKSEIRAYDVLKSPHNPQLVIDLKQFPEFANQVATSITFGSTKNLTGALTLYVSTASHIYAVYPFIIPSSRISTTPECIDIALEETKTAMELIQENFPGNLLETASSGLNKAALKQFEYYTYLKNQLASPSTLKTKDVTRYPNSTKAFEPYVLYQELSGWEAPSLQGPIATATSANTLPIEDIFAFADNEHVSLIASVSSMKKNDGTTISYYGQLAPMLMKSKQHGDIEVPQQLEPPAPKAKTLIATPEYIKPKRGFGFVDLAGKEEEEEAEAAQKQSTENLALVKYHQESKFWSQELAVLDVLHTDSIQIRNDSNRASYFGKLDEYKFAVIIDCNLAIIDCAPWVDAFVSQLANKSEDMNVEINSCYSIATTGTDLITSFAYIKDIVAGTGEYLLVVRNRQENDLEMIHVVDTTPEETIVSLKTDFKKIELPENQVSDEPFESITQGLKYLLLNQIGTTVSSKLAGQKIEETGEYLSALNDISTDTINSVTNFTTFGISLQSRILSQLDALKSQAKIVLKVSEQSGDDKTLKEQQEKIDSLIANQEKLNKRMDDLLKKIFDSIQKYRSAKSLPLSEAERSWFTELNSINAKVNVGTKDDESITHKVENLKGQVATIVNKVKTGKDRDVDHLKQLELERRVSKLRSWLHHENEMIESIKSKLQKSLQAVETI